MNKKSLTKIQAIIIVVIIIIAAIAGISYYYLMPKPKIELELWFCPVKVGIEEDLTKLLSDFEKETNIKVSYLVVPWAELVDKLKAALAAGKGPDVTMVTGDRYASIQHLGGFLPLDDLAKEIRGDLIDPEGTLDFYVKGGHYYWIPFYGASSLAVINVDLFKEAGIPDEMIEKMARGEWNLNDFLYLLDKLRLDRDKDGVIDTWGYVYPGNTRATGVFLSWVHIFGGEVFDENGNPILDSPQVLEAVKFIASLKPYMPPGFESITPEISEYWPAGRQGIHIYATTLPYVSDLWPKNYPNLHFKVVTQPIGPTGKVEIWWEPGGLAMFKTCPPEKQDAAKKLIKYFVSPKGQEWIVKSVKREPVMKGPYYDMLREVVKGTAGEDFLDLILKFRANAHRPKPFPYHAAITAIYNEEMHLVLIGEKTPEQAVKDMQKRALEAVKG